MKAKKGTFFITGGLLLIAAALLLTLYNVWDNYRVGKVSDAVIEQLVPQINDDPIPAEGRPVYTHTGKDAEMVPAEIEYPYYVLNPEMDMPVGIVDGEDYIGTLTVPSLDLYLPVISDWSYPKLRSAPCRYTGTAYQNDLVICAHNYAKHFGNLKNLRIGDTVTFTDMDGNVFNYEVLEVLTLQPTAIEEMITGDWDMTLFTCTIGGATRVTVRCERV